MYYLLDLERSIVSGKTWYWKRNRHGYTQLLSQAGLFDEDEARNLVTSDVNKRTIMIAEETVEDILNQ
jgi:hypothetical protein